MAMTTLIVDDEADARARLTRMLEAHCEIVVIGEAQDGLEALEKIEELKPDLLFLDIEMPGLHGFDVLRSIPQDVPVPLVIFVTGYDQYALAAFESNALAYLMKPVDPDRLALAVERAQKLLASGDKKEVERKNILRAARESSRTLRQIVCRKGGRMVLVPVEQVLWFKVEAGIVKAKTSTSPTG
jgi:DNA-binding LytR/AlgR family response regulator